jgi:hypothetical protein
MNDLTWRLPIGLFENAGENPALTASNMFHTHGTSATIHGNESEKDELEPEGH